MLTDPTPTDLRAAFDAQNAAFRAAPAPTLAERRAHLDALTRSVHQHRAALLQAMDADFGGRSRHEAELADVVVTLESIAYLRRKLPGLMRSKRRWVPAKMLLASAWVQPQPLGVVGVMAPWNYPVNLALVPVATALAAGNRVLLKPSELTPATSAVLAELLADAFPDDRVLTVLGGAKTGGDFAALPFHHLLFTGSTAVGRLVAQAAAPNLTPLTLELGGKSPAILHPECDHAHAVDSVVLGKLFNAGQTCIAPDYLLVHRDQVEQVVALAQAAVERRYPALPTNTQYTSIINDRHRARLQHLLDDAAQRGARVIPLGAGAPPGGRLRPHLVLDAPADAAILQEEIFGPLLPIIPFDTLEDALNYVNDRPRPLALYYFDNSAARRDQVLQHTISGGVTVNGTVYHFAIEDLPFGGVGAAGMGAYHGPEGFNTFSHLKPVLQVGWPSSMSLIAPPYGHTMELVMRWLFP